MTEKALVTFKGAGVAFREVKKRDKDVESSM